MSRTRTSRRRPFAWLTGGLIAIATAIGITVAVVDPPMPEPPPVDPAAFRIEFAGDPGRSEAMAPLAGISVRDPLNRDGNRLTVDQGPLAVRFLSLPMGFYRHTAGSQSYDVTSISDPGMQYTLRNVLPRLNPATRHDFTFPPTLNPADLSQWVTERTGRISLANEPPIHIGPKDAFASVDAYVNWAASVIELNPDHADHFYVQSGKPEILEGTDAPQSAKLRHQQVQDAVAAAVLEGRLPARVITTHKLLPDYGTSDWYTFYAKLLDSYRAAYGSDVRICFQEYNWREEDTLSQDVLLGVSQFLLVLSRLRHEQGNIVDGAAYHQGSSVKGSAIIGQDAGGNWRATALTDLWEHLAGSLVYDAYVPTVAHNRPAEVAAEVFERADGSRVLLFSNRSNVDQTVLLPGSPAFSLLIVNQQTVTGAAFTGVLPARSCGAINL